MKIDAKIKWLIDEPKFNIHVDDITKILVDEDYVNANVEDITEWVENVLADKYHTGFYVSQDDFIIMNMEELIENLKHEEFLDKATI